MEEFGKPVSEESIPSEVTNREGDMNVPEKEDGVERISRKIGEVINNSDEIDRRKFLSIFLKSVIVGGVSAALSSCNVKPEDLYEAANTPVPESHPTELPTEQPLLGTEKEYSERGFTLVKDPYKINTNEFIVGDKGYSTAITEKFEFPALDESGRKYPLKYGKDFDVVTFLHYTGKKPPVVGEIVPLVYELPEEAKSKGVDIFPFAISVMGNMSKQVNFNENSNYYLMPIVTSGSASGIMPTTDQGNIVNSIYPSIDVIPDSVSQNPNGYLSWALLTQEDEKVVMEGVIDNTAAKLYIDHKDVPEEISSLYV